MTIVAHKPVSTVNGLARYRHDLGLSQRQAAKVTGISRTRLQELEAETKVTPASVRVALTYVALRVLVDGPPFLGSNGRAA